MYPLSDFNRFTHVNKGVRSMLVKSEVYLSMKHFFMKNSTTLDIAFTQLANGILGIPA